jgi:hypothetical protein
MTELAPEPIVRIITPNLTHEASPDVLAPVERGSVLDHDTYLTAAASRKLGHLTAAVSTAFATGGVFEFASHRLASGSLLELIGISGIVMAHAMTEDANDKRKLDELTLPYTLRVRPDRQNT